jgi:hypothetical protein
MQIDVDGDAMTLIHPRIVKMKLPGREHDDTGTH